MKRLFLSASVLLLTALGCRRPPPFVDTDTGRWTDDTGLDTDTGAPEPRRLRSANDRAYLPLARAAIRDAQTRVWVIEFVIYDSGSPKLILDDLLAAAERGVDVRLLADEEGGGTAAALQRLTDGGVLTRLDEPTVTTHNKLLLADELTLVGSHNLTSSALDDNTEASVFVDLPEVTAHYAAYFEALWASPGGIGPLPVPATDPVIPLHDRQITPALQGCLQQAEDTVDLVLYALAYDTNYPDSNVSVLLTALVDAHERGVDVRVVLDDSQWIADNRINTAAVQVLRQAGVDVRFPPSSRTTHAKMLACDDTVIVSDANWSYSGLDLYNGTSLQAMDAGLASDYRAWVDGIWAGSTPAP